ncbi:MAG TPA: phage gp6-like head-tail connector protein [Nitrospiraceae bacterium]|nr:phage gp6-like head-tail connector protein [Nitrospiraceae bacterium]
MSVLPLEDIKSYLDVFHSADDVKLQLLLDGAEDEAAQFMNRADVSEWESEYVFSSDYLMPPGTMLGVLLLVQAAYQANPDDADKLRRAAETKLMPYRLHLGC